MLPLLYRDLVDWYYLIDPTADHEDEAIVFHDGFQRAIVGSSGAGQQTLLELGCGAGNNASFMKQYYDCTLADLSPQMLALSRDLNPECAHVEGDMRTLRLGRTFDAVLVHDAIMYMLAEADLRAAIMTAFAHTRPGGAAVFTPDCVRETLREYTDVHSNDERSRGRGERSLRCLEWTWDPDPSDTTFAVEYAFLLRDGNGVRAVHDHHTVGVFPRATWVEAIEDAGFEAENLLRPLGDGSYDECFLARRP